MFKIAEADWKLFKELHPIALERLCERILQESLAVIQRTEVSAHERYLALYKLIEKRDDDVANAFNDFRRSTAVMQLGNMRSMGLLRAEEMKRFSPETIQLLELAGPIRDEEGFGQK